MDKQKSLANRESERKQRVKTLKSLEEKRKMLVKEIAELSKSETAYREFENDKSC